MAAASAREKAWHERTRRALEYAVAASLALHALALLFLPALRAPVRPAPTLPPLEARLVPAQPAAAPAPPPAPRVEQKRVPEARKPAPRPKPRLVAKPVLNRAQPTPAPAPVVAPAPAPEPPAPVVAQPVVPAAAVRAAPAFAPAPAAAPDDPAALLANYRKLIIEQAARYKRYPRVARDNGWEGRVEVRMAIGADGAIASMRVARGTGYAVLDDQALDMVRSAKPDTAIPDGLRGKSFAVDIPVIFSLRDDDG